jgi:putative nucleotidyltransferase with HDIG domain
MDRQAAWELLCEYTKGDGLRKHGLAVEAVMRHFARKHGEDEERWGIAGLLHDFDYEANPTMEGHPYVGSKVLEERGYPEDVRRAIMGHADYTGVPRDTLMARVLYAVDELTGFVTAVALLRPNKSLAEVEPRSVRKKMKDKAFARSVNRDDIIKGAEELGVDLDEHIAEVIEAMRPLAAELGLGA